MTEQLYRKFVRIFAVVDLFACIGFATPWSFALMQSILRMFGPLPAFEPMNLMFIYLLGTICVMWGILRIAKPESWLGFTDALARCVFGFWMIYFLLGFGINPLVWLFASLELVPAAFMIIFYFRRHKA